MKRSERNAREMKMVQAYRIKLAVLCSGLLFSAGAALPGGVRAEPFDRWQSLAIVKYETGGMMVEEKYPWSAAEIIEPADLMRLLSGKDKPVILQIGIARLYKIGHIPGSKYAGPADTAEGLDTLKKQVQGLDRNTVLVCYCGCCPWVNCPNTRPAYKTLREMGFKNIKMLYLPNTFTQDWGTKGLPLEKGGA